VRLFLIVVLSLLFIPALAASQNNDNGNGQLLKTQVDSAPPDPRSPPERDVEMQPMSSMDPDQMRQMRTDNDGQMSMKRPKTFIEEIENHETSGTSAEPNSTPTPMWTTVKGDWMVMFHANAFITDEQQSSSRGGDRFFSTNWFMPMAQRTLGPGTLTIRTMLSLEPATVTDRRYPLLFQQGETAFGVPIADGQHPHNFFMEMAGLYDLKLGEKSLLSFYVAPVGDPALGPTAYPHRASALEDPVGTLGHHQEDSTHIAYDVVTTGLAYRALRIEASGFHGREPDENRWTISQGAIDSWSTRLTIQPGQNWSAQYSYGRLQSPEALFPTDNQERMTASIMYNRPLQNGNWASTVLWGRTRSLQANSIFNSYLFESTLQFLKRNYVWTRIENAERSNELIVGENPLPPGFREEPIGQVQAYTFGYDHDFALIPRIASAFGGQVTTYSAPDTLKPIYGSHPVGVAVFLRLRPVPRGNN
jgi:hypothetical protein